MIILKEGMCGSDKTGSMLKEIAETPSYSYVYLGETHKFLEQTADRLHQLGVDSTVWYGISFFDSIDGKRVYGGLCPKYGKCKMISHLIEKHTSANIICRVCRAIYSTKAENEKRKTCPHHMQFKKTKRVVLCNVNYLNTKYVENLDSDYIVMDDVTGKMRELESWTKLEGWLKVCQEYNYRIPLIESSIEPEYSHVSICIFPDLSSLIDYINAIGEAEVKRLINYLKVQMVTTLENMKKNDIAPPDDFLLDPVALLEWAETYTVSRGKKTWAKPYVLDGFRWAIDNPERNIYILDAHIPKKIVGSLMKRMGGEVETLWTRQPAEPKTKKIWRVASAGRGVMPFTADTTKSPRWVKQNISQMEHFIKDRFGNRAFNTISVGIASFKKQRNIYDEWSRRFKEFKFVNYGGSRGDNDVRLVDIMFAVGTYSVPIVDIIRKYLYFYLRYPNSKDGSSVIPIYDEKAMEVWVKDNSYWDNRYGRRFNVDVELNEFGKWVSEYEQYQAIHRCRPIDRDVPIFCICAVPEYLEQEFEVEVVQASKVAGGLETMPAGNARVMFFNSCIPDYQSNIVMKLKVKFGISDSVAKALIKRLLDDDDREPQPRYYVKKIHRDGSDKPSNWIEWYDEHAGYVVDEPQFEEPVEEYPEEQTPSIDEVEAEARLEHEREMNSEDEPEPVDDYEYNIPTQAELDAEVQAELEKHYQEMMNDDSPED